MRDRKKWIYPIILTAVLSWAAWVTLDRQANAAEHARMQEDYKGMRELLVEVRSDVKDILRRLAK
jgi:hypothetical protein